MAESSAGRPARTHFAVTPPCSPAATRSAAGRADSSATPDGATPESAAPDDADLLGERHPPDVAARRLVAGALDETLFVAAGAGSGKTTALISRIVNLVLAGVPITQIAAVTFTEKAAAELRHRLRAALAAPPGGATAEQSELAATALADLDHAPIGTLHAFARRLLTEFPVESELPPSFEVLDEVQSAIAFEERYADFVEALLEDPGQVRLVELCEHDRFRLDRGAKRMAQDFQDNWDLVVERVDARLPDPADPGVDELVARCAAIGAADVPAGDRQAEKVAWIGALGQRLGDDPVLSEVLAVLATLRDVKPGSWGNKANWKRAGLPDGALDALRAEQAELAALAAARLSALDAERRLTLGALLHGFTLDAVRDRCAAGRLEFHDLLVLARRLVAEHANVRRALHQRYTHLLLDEFQDTDPIQLELAVRIAAAPDGQGDDWTALVPLPGRLCVVGDAKQSIYRFRRADIAQFLRAAEQIEATTATLSANFRSTPAVIDWVNHTMGRLITYEPDAQPEYEPLAASRTAAAHHGSVRVLGAEAHAERLTADDLRGLEAADVADVAVRAVAEGWPVARRGADGTAALAPCTLGDITILLPARTSLPALQVALAARDIPYRAENSSLVYAAPEIRALLLALRGADDPSDELAIVSALRTPLYGCSDRDLFDWRVTRGLHWNWYQDVPQALMTHPVAEGLRSIGALAARIPWSTPSELLAGLVDERAALELALATRHGRDVWRRVRYVVDQARAWSEAGGHGVRRYLTWTRLQGDDGRFVAETVLPETDHDAVRIMTVHAAKGLEFPITIVSGMTTQPQVRRAQRVVWLDDTWTLAGKGDPIYETYRPVDELMGDSERRRLLYVATTRAQDHLVVSLHRKAGDNDRTSAAWLAAASDGARHEEHVAGGGSLPASVVEPVELPWADEQAWATRREAALAAASNSTVLSATALARRQGADAATDPAMRKDAVDLDVAPWQRGRYGTAVGRAVHAVLQHADLADGHDLAVLAASQAAAEGVLGLEATIEALARSALGTAIVRTAVGHQHWRELFVATAVGEHVVEGYIDLLVRHPDRGLVVVDHKTDQLDASTTGDERLTRYGRQLAAYAIALESLLGEPVAAGVLVMCRTDGTAEELEIPGWTALQAELRAGLLAPRSP
ncbi:MAG: UvrD-helicase domain-containing protein [Ilumatobacteraceae bacterium]